MLRKFVATVVTVLLAAVIAAPAQAAGNSTVTEWHTWKIPVDCPVDLNGKGSADNKGWSDCSPTPPFPQTYVGKGQLVPPCGVWYQQDQYTGSRKAIDDVLKDNKLTYSNGKPEDHAIVKAWKFVYGGDCIPPQPKDKVVKTDWVEKDWKCGDEKITLTREVTTTKYVWKDGKWVLDTKNSKTVTETKKRDLTKSERDSCKPKYVIVAWKMPSWSGNQSATWPQTYVTHKKINTVDLSALDGYLNSNFEYGCFQVDVYKDSAKTDALIAAGTLYAPGNPPEDHVPGAGWNYSYKLVKIGNSCDPPKPADLEGIKELPPTFECVTPKNGTSTKSTWAKKWTQSYVWDTTSKSWVLGDKVWGEPYVTGTTVVDDQNCIPKKPKGLKGFVQLPPTYECVTPKNGTGTFTYWGKKWTQDYVWDANAKKWVLGEKVWGEPYITNTKVVDDKHCIPVKPKGLKGFVHLPPTYECVTPKNGTGTFTYWGKTWTQNYVWDKTAKAWVLGEKVWSAPFITGTKVIDDKHCIPPKPPRDKGFEPLDPTYECVEPLNGTSTKTSWAKKWTVDYTWDKTTRTWVAGEPVWGEPFITGTEVVDDETCIPEPPADRGVDPFEPTYECVVPANGKAKLTSYELPWTQTAAWDNELRDYVLGEKLFGDPVITSEEFVDDAECDPIEPTITAELVPQCIQNVPFVDWKVTLIDPDNQVTEKDKITFTFLNTSGNGDPDEAIVVDPVNWGEGNTATGTFVWPGATYTGSLPGTLVGTNWPGWTFDGDEWVETGDDYFGWTLGGANIHVAVNPETVVEDVVYPEAEFPCTPLEELNEELPAPPAKPVTADAQYAG